MNISSINRKDMGVDTKYKSFLYLLNKILREVF